MIYAASARRRGSNLLKKNIESLGVKVHVGKRTTGVAGDDRYAPFALLMAKHSDVHDHLFRRASSRAMKSPRMRDSNSTIAGESLLTACSERATEIFPPS